MESGLFVTLPHSGHLHELLLGQFLVVPLLHFPGLQFLLDLEDVLANDWLVEGVEHALGP